MARRSFRVPHTLVLLFAMIVVALLLTWLLPAGAYERVENEQGRTQVVPGTFATVPDVPTLSPLVVFTAIPRGLAAAAEIIFFVFIIGGAFALLRATGAVDAFLGSVLRRLGHQPLWLLAGGILVFMAGSSTIGMAEEFLPFVPILVALALALRFDALTGVAIVTIGYSVGYGVATINPFTVLIAQDVAGLQPGSGMWYRLVLAAVFVPLGVHHVWRYARRVRSDPATSLVADVAPPPMERPAPGGPGLSAEPGGGGGLAETPPLTGRHVTVLAVLVGGLALLVWGLTQAGWYLVEMSALFAALAVVIAALGRISPDRSAAVFVEGATELTTTALLIGFARAIQVVLDQGQVIDTIVHGLSVPLQALGPSLAAVGMMIVQSVTNLFIPSGSGQAYVTMPIMAPLADVIEIPRQVAVLAYQFGDGFTNILVPTNPVIIGILAMAGIPYDRWLRFVLPFMLKVWVVGALALMVAVWIGYQ
jgi:uncharacterized ion transporter superfamily protein YfcC